MKIIDLLNKIANGEKLPKEIIVFKRKFHLTADNTYKYVYKNFKNDLFEWLALDRNYSLLNDEIEIIEEPKKIDIPKHIPNEVIQDLDRAICPVNVKCIAHKVNELINYLQHINKGENNE